MPTCCVNSAIVSGGLGALGYLTAAFLAHSGKAQCALRASVQYHCPLGIILLMAVYESRHVLISSTR